MKELRRQVKIYNRIGRQIINVQAVTGMPFERAEAMVDAWIKDGYTVVGDTLEHMETQARAYVLRVCRGETESQFECANCGKQLDAEVHVTIRRDVKVLVEPCDECMDSKFSEGYREAEIDHGIDRKES